MLNRPQTAAHRSTTPVVRGTGAGDYKVKGKRATAKQRATIDGCLAQAAADNAGRRTMVAVVMTITQESNAGEDQGKTGNDDLGIYQQGRNWIDEKGAKDPAKSTHAFLVTGPTSWKKVHGGLKKAPGNLSLAIHQVQGNRDPAAYAPWEKEAEKTVDTWLATGGEGTVYYLKKYTFTRGEKGGQRENSWDAAGRLTSEVGAYRWAAANVFYAASGDELRAGAPSLTIRGTEGFLLKRPAWSWAGGRAISEVTLQVLADRWDILPGGVVLLDRRLGAAMAGRWLVWNVSGASLDSPEATVVLRRPTRLRREPANEVGERTIGSGSGSDLQQACETISRERGSYVYGAGHGPALKTLKSSAHLDCSSAVSLALYRAGLFEGRTHAIVSGEFASSYGKAGKGDEFTVWANGEHVWIEGYDATGKPAWRFDTSHHGGKSGAAYTVVPRTDQGRFTARHHPGH